MPALRVSQSPAPVQSLPHGFGGRRRSRQTAPCPRKDGMDLVDDQFRVSALARLSERFSLRLRCGQCDGRGAIGASMSSNLLGSFSCERCCCRLWLSFSCSYCWASVWRSRAESTWGGSRASPVWSSPSGLFVAWSDCGDQSRHYGVHRRSQTDRSRRRAGRASAGTGGTAGAVPDLLTRACARL